MKLSMVNNIITKYILNIKIQISNIILYKDETQIVSHYNNNIKNEFHLIEINVDHKFMDC
jgi:hypothetical protein